MLNRVQFIGNLTRDSQFNGKEGRSARSVIFLAVNSRFRNGDGWKTQTDYPIVVTFGSRAVYASGLTKGEKVLVEANYRTQRYEKDGETHFTNQLIATTVQRLQKPTGAADAEESENAADSAPDHDGGDENK